MYFNQFSKQQLKCLLSVQAQLLRHAKIFNRQEAGKNVSNVAGVSRWTSTNSNSQRLQNAILTSPTRSGHNIRTDEDLDSDTVPVNDQLSIKLIACQDYTNLLDTLTRRQAQLQKHHYVESTMLLWNFYRLTTEAVDKQKITDSLNQVILPGVQANIAQMDISEISCCYLYLRKMRIPNSDPIVQSLLLKALQLVEDSVELVPLTALSRLAVAINLDRDFFAPLVCRHFMPHLERHVANCATDEDTRLLATCMFQLHRLVDSELMDDYKTRVRGLLKSRILSNRTPRALLKVLHMLNIPTWSALHAHLIREVLQELSPSLKQMEPIDLKTVCRSFLHHQEPGTLVQPLKEATELMLEQECTPDVLACVVPFAAPQQRERYIELFKQMLHDKDTWLQFNASGHFFSILRSLKIADVGLCDAYWSGVIEELNGNDDEQLYLRFLRHCQRYMNFNNNLGGTYRHLNVERKLSQMCMHAIEYDIAGRLPSKLARLASFVLAYGHTPFAWKKFPNLILSKILSMTTQFNINDCFLISRGLQIAQELRFRHHMPSVLGMQFSTIEGILVACAERHLSSSDELSVTDLNCIIRTLSYRKSLKNTVVYKQALERYNQLDCHELNSRAVRDMAYNLTASSFLVPDVLESMFAYITEHYAHITGDTVEKVLTCAYNLGYTPHSPEVLDYAAIVLLRDFDQMSGLSLVQACLALCFYKTIPEELINKVFCVKFIQRVEDEIQICYSKATYPERVLNLVMQLNRTVCLDFPEANVPWFQQNYVEAQLSKKPILQTNFSNDVRQLLKELLKAENYFRCNHTTPYGYQIDFVIHFDRNQKPIPDPVETTMLDRITKVAILLMKLDSFCDNDLNALRGPESLKVKHLEIMGYKVLHINEHDWNSKYMSAPGAKANYLKCLLQISH